LERGRTTLYRKKKEPYGFPSPCFLKRKKRKTNKKKKKRICTRVLARLEGKKGKEGERIQGEKEKGKEKMSEIFSSPLYAQLYLEWGKKEGRRGDLGEGSGLIFTQILAEKRKRTEKRKGTTTTDSSFLLKKGKRGGGE